MREKDRSDEEAWPRRHREVERRIVDWGFQAETTIGYSIILHLKKTRNFINLVENI